VRFLHKGSAFILRLGRDRAVMQACPRLTRFNRPNNLQMGASAFKWGDPAWFGCICPPLFAEKLYRPFFGFISPGSDADAAPQHNRPLNLARIYCRCWLPSPSGQLHAMHAGYPTA